MIVVKIQGGLGNQMFQYALGRRLQKAFGQQLVLDISAYSLRNERNYSLKHLSISDDVITDVSGRYNFIYDFRVNQLIKITNRICPNVYYDLMSKFGVFIWDSVEYKKLEIDRKHKNIYLQGYWQSEEYFSDIEDLIKKELKVHSEPDKKNMELIKELQRNESVCVHVRRGDYLSKKDVYRILDEGYFNKGMSYIKDIVSNPVFYVFSDDIDDVKHHFHFTERNIKFVELDNPDFQELRLMYQCKHYVLSNSTFSWWAEFLSEHKQRVVIAPGIWYRNVRDMSHLLRKNWVIL